MTARKSSLDGVSLKLELRAAGLKGTAPRIAVLEALRAAKRPLSHAEVADGLEPRGFDRASVYRVLMDLTDAGLLARRDHGDHVWRFEYRDGATKEARAGHAAEHAHFVCNDCGDVQCLPEAEVKLPRALARRSVAVEVKGLCQRCG